MSLSMIQISAMLSSIFSNECPNHRIKEDCCNLQDKIHNLLFDAIVKNKVITLERVPANTRKRFKQ